MWPHCVRSLAVDRNRRVQYTWKSPFTRGLESTVTLEKERHDTRLTLTHAGLPDDDFGRLHDGGWEECLGKFLAQFPARSKD